MSCKNNTERYVGGKSLARIAEPTLWAGLVAIELTSILFESFRLKSCLALMCLSIASRRGDWLILLCDKQLAAGG